MYFLDGDCFCKHLTLPEREEEKKYGEVGFDRSRSKKARGRFSVFHSNLFLLLVHLKCKHDHEVEMKAYLELLL